ncbi:MAG: hypothetical protein H0W72_08710 [Planctomycetes bacterium]|nr:hypothetical protein [Planctomycetota bacterium]
MLALLATTWLCAAPAQDLELRAPLTTLITASEPLSGAGDGEVRAEIVVPADAPSDLGVGAYLVDRHGAWFQRCLPGTLGVGTHQVAIRLGAADAVTAEGERAGWDAAQASAMHRGGLFFWSASSSRARLVVHGLTIERTPDSAAAGARLLDLRLPAAARTGQRWELGVLPQPFPASPDDPDAFALDLVVTRPDGTSDRLPGFHHQPMLVSDRGDRELIQPDEAARFCVRWRPCSPGLHQLRLEARWQGGAAVTAELPAVDVAGERWDEYVRVDARDPRFFAVGDPAAAAFFWPVGPNLRSVWDLRSRDRLGTTITPDRGSLAYESYLRRIAAGGGTAVEIWMSSWNLALEWRAEWPGFHGVGRYNQANACRLDRILEVCGELGIRVNLVVLNHGQASDQTDREWQDSAYNTANGGRVAGAREFFSDPWALAKQDHLRRYLVARYADHPAILGWKLWSEVNLTAGRRDEVRRWHEQACARWRALDTYGHPVTTHWSGDYRNADAGVVALPGLGYACIDAYHPPASANGYLLADLLLEGIQPEWPRSLGRYGKPVLVTEYGGNWDAAPEPQIIAEHLQGPWACLVAGYAGAPMLWWFEWLDQRDRWGDYRAIGAFLRGEDLRDPRARSVQVPAEVNGAAAALWSAAWSRPGRRLGYLLDRAWGGNGVDAAGWNNVTLVQGEVAAGTVEVEWWDPQSGTVSSTSRVEHPGGMLRLTVPPFRHHLAWKLARSPDAVAPGPADPASTSP